MAALLGLVLSGIARGSDAPRGVASLRGPVSVIAHRGASGQAPENTMAAFRAAADQGVGFELDVVLCASGEVVVLHDDTVDRTTDGTGPVADLTLADLRGLDAGSWFSAEFAGEPIPTLRQVLEAFGGTVPIDIELKQTDRREALALAVVGEIEALGLVDHVLVTSFDPKLLGAVRRLNPNILRGQLTATFEDAGYGWLKTMALRHMWLNGTSRPDVVAVQHSRVDAAFMRRMDRRGLQVIAWTVNDAERAAALRALGVIGIITDFPERATGG